MRLYNFSSIKGLTTKGKNVETLVSELKKKGLKIVLTSGSFDLLHIGHTKYLRKAKKLGNILIVGLDSDEKVRQRKGPSRPIVSEEERSGILSDIRHVDFIILKDVKDEQLSILKAVRPDVLVISETTKHREEKIRIMSEFCKKVVVLKAQSISSTTARVRRLFVDGAGKFAKRLTPKLIEIIERELHNFENGGNE